MQTRRSFIQLVAAGGAVVGSGILLPRFAWATSEVQALLGDLHQVDRWTVVHVGAVRFGVIPVTMEAADGSRFQIEIAARDPESPRGVAETEKFALYLSNGGDGQTATVEEHGLGVMALAAELRRRERGSALRLKTLRERLA